MARVSVLKLACVVLAAICMVLMAVPHAAQPSKNCNGLEENLTPCVEYLKSSGTTQGAPPANCCAGVRSVKAMSNTRPERVAVCECLKRIAASIQDLNYDVAAKLPAQCGVTLSYTISPNTDCTKIGQ